MYNKNNLILISIKVCTLKLKEKMGLYPIMNLHPIKGVYNKEKINNN